jgi:hypothetical protein
MATLGPVRFDAISLACPLCGIPITFSAEMRPSEEQRPGCITFDRPEIDGAPIRQHLADWHGKP